MTDLSPEFRPPDYGTPAIRGGRYREPDDAPPDAPAIRPDAPMAEGCEYIRRLQFRRRCLDPRCGRCWGAATLTTE